MIDNHYHVNRVIRIFLNESENLIGELELTSFDLPMFRQLFHVTDPSNPMFDCYEITPEITKSIESHLSSIPDWNFQKFSYFIEADAE